MITLPGADVSSFQGVPGQWRSAVGNVAWLGIKFTELEAGKPLYTSPDALADWAAAKAMGVFRLAYLFAHPAAGPVATVDGFLSVLGPVLADGDGVAIDLEVNDGLPPERVAGWAQQTSALLGQKTGRPVVLYTFPNFSLEGNCDGLGHLPLWLAAPSSPAGNPDVPGPWTNWIAQQTDISGDVDRDLAAFPSITAMRAALGKPAPKPKPKPVREEPVLLSTGLGAVTPIAFRNGETKVRFFPGSGDQAGLSVEFNGHPPQAVTLAGGAGSVDIPAGADGCRVIRDATGATVAVSAVTE